MRFEERMKFYQIFLFDQILYEFILKLHIKESIYQNQLFQQRKQIRLDLFLSYQRLNYNLLVIN